MSINDLARAGLVLGSVGAGVWAAWLGTRIWRCKRRYRRIYESIIRKIEELERDREFLDVDWVAFEEHAAAGGPPLPYEAMRRSFVVENRRRTRPGDGHGE